MPEMVKYCKTHSPRETMRFRDIRSRSILKVEQLLSGILTGKQLRKAEDWYTNPVLPPHFHAARPDGKKIQLFMSLLRQQESIQNLDISGLMK